MEGLVKLTAENTGREYREPVVTHYMSWLFQLVVELSFNPVSCHRAVDLMFHAVDLMFSHVVWVVKCHMVHFNIDDGMHLDNN